MLIKKVTKNLILTAILELTIISPVFAAGLDEATKATDEIGDWLYLLLGSVVFIFLIYKICMAMMEKETWGDVMVALGKVAAAGGVVTAGQWAWSIWGA